MRISEKLLQVEDLRKTYGSGQNKYVAFRIAISEIFPARRMKLVK